jgi:hypothetical protein
MHGNLLKIIKNPKINLMLMLTLIKQKHQIILIYHETEYNNKKEKNLFSLYVLFNIKILFLLKNC